MVTMSEISTAVTVGIEAEKKQEEPVVLDPDDATLAGENDADSQMKINDLCDDDIDRLLAPETEDSDANKAVELSAEDLLGTTDSMTSTPSGSSEEVSLRIPSAESATELMDTDDGLIPIDEFKPSIEVEEKNLSMEELFGGISATALIKDDPAEGNNAVSAKMETDDDDVVFVEDEKAEKTNGVANSVAAEDNDIVLLSDDEDARKAPVAAEAVEAVPEPTSASSGTRKLRQMRQMIRCYLESKDPVDQAVVTTRLEMQKVKDDVVEAERKMRMATKEFHIRTDLGMRQLKDDLDDARKKIVELEQQLLQKKLAPIPQRTAPQQNGHRVSTRSTTVNPVYTNYGFSNGKPAMPPPTSTYRAIAPKPRAVPISPLAKQGSTRSTSAMPANARSTLAMPASLNIIPSSAMKTKITVNIPKVEATPSGVHDPFDAQPLPDYPMGTNRLPRDQVNVVLKTEYESFLLTKKIHGSITYPTGFPSPEGKAVRLYYLIESMHKGWQYSETAQLSMTGTTKFIMSFDIHQKLYSGDRVTFIAFVFVDQATKYVSDRAVFKFRPPPGFKRLSSSTSGPTEIVLDV